MRELSRPTLACVAVCAGVLVVAAADFAHVQSRMADPTTLEQQYQARAWLYSSAIIAAIAVATGIALRTRRRLGWQRVFTNLGIAGVWSGIAATVIVGVNDGDAVALPGAPVFAPAVAMIAAAAVGTMVGRKQGWGNTDAVAEARAGATALGKQVGRQLLGGLLADSRRESVGRFFSTWAFALTAGTVLLALIFIPPQPACGGSEAEPPGWTETVGAIAGITSIGAIAAGMGALLLRRWFPALVGLVANPFALLFMAASTCAFY